MKQFTKEQFLTELKKMLKEHNNLIGIDNFTNTDWMVIGAMNMVFERLEKTIK